MNFSKKNHKRVGQNASGFKKPQKHDANLQKNTTLYFQVGLILVLLLTYGLFELNFETKSIDLNDYAISIEDESEIYVQEYKVLDETKKQEPKQEKKQKRILHNPVIIDDPDGDLIETKDLVSPDNFTTDKSLDPRDIDVIEVIEDDPIGVEFVQEVPIYPGCEKQKTNKAKKKCMSDKIGKLISRKFNTRIASDLGLEGTQRINVLFKIDKHGNVSEVKAQSKYLGLIKEAKRVVGKIPQMKPGKQNNKEVSVMYALPILFDVR